MTNFKNAAPRINFGGIDDQSRGTLVQEPQTFAQHTPLLRLMCEWGPTETTPVGGTDGGAFNSIFGAKTLARRGKFFNTQSLLAETCLGAGNGFFVKRLVPDNAPAPARIVLALDIVRDRVRSQIRDLGGFNYPGQEGNTQVAPAEEDIPMVMGYRARLVAIDANKVEVGRQERLEGSLVSEETGDQSTLYPLLELPARFVGSRGNLLGMRLWAPTMYDNIPYDDATAEAFQTRMYRLQFMSKLTDGAAASVLRTKNGDQYVDICFTPGAYSASTDMEYYAPDIATQAYEDDGRDSGTTPLYGPFSELHVYQDNLDTIQQMIHGAEIAANPAAETLAPAPGLMDVFGGRDQEGNPYASYIMEGPLKGGILLNDTNMVFAQGGGDGSLDAKTYEAMVARENLNFGQLGDEYENVAVYPFTVVYDSGLSMDGKYQMMSVLGARQDLRCVFTTFSELDVRPLTRAEEISRATALMAALRAYPESTLYATPVCRAEIIHQSGKLSGGGYTKQIPMLVDYVKRWAEFAGRGDGVLVEGKDIDVAPNNRVTEVRSLNVDFFNERTQSNMWEQGGTYTLSYDRRSQYYPALHSVYTDDTSVLISPITVAICCDIMRLIRRVHADFSGNAKLTKEQFIERSDELISRLVAGRYAERVRVIPRTYFTAADDQRGFSWHNEVTVLANNPYNVMTFDLVTKRMEEYDDAQA